MYLKYRAMKQITISERVHKLFTNKQIDTSYKEVKKLKNIKVGKTGKLKGGLHYVLMKNGFLLF